MTSGSVVVLGGTGFLGNAIGRKFIERHHDVTIVARHPTSMGLEGAEFRAVNVAGDRAGLIDLFNAADQVVFAVGGSLPAESLADPLADANTNLAPILNVLEALRAYPTVRLTVLSSGGTVYGNAHLGHVPERVGCDPISAYGVAKLAAEKYVGMYAVLYGIETQILRVANAYGPGQPIRASQGAVAAFFDAALNDHPVHLFGDGSNIRDFVYVDDISDAVVELASRPIEHPILNVGSGEPCSIAELIDLVGVTTGHQLQIDRLPARSFDVGGVVLDVSLLASAIPWRPILLPDGLARTWSAIHSGAGPEMETRRE